MRLAGLAFLLALLPLTACDKPKTSDEPDTGSGSEPSVVVEEPGEEPEVPPVDPPTDDAVEDEFGRSEIRPTTVPCQTDSDCVKDSCCHATSCIAATQALDCSQTTCTADCRAGTMDCNGGCLCQDGTCAAKVWYAGE